MRDFTLKVHRRRSGAAPAPEATIVDTIQGGGSSSPQSGGTTLTATGSNRAGLLSVMTNGASPTATINGTSSRSLTLDDFRGTTGSNFEYAAQFVIEEADFAAAGDGPYAIEVTSAGATKLGFVAASVQDAPTAPSSDIVSGSNTNSNVFDTRPPVDSLILAAHGSSTAADPTWTNATELEENRTFGDGAYLAWARQAGSDITISSTVQGRDVFALYAFPRG